MVVPKCRIYTPWNKTASLPLKIGHPERKQSYSNNPFSGALLVLGGYQNHLNLLYTSLLSLPWWHHVFLVSLRKRNGYGGYFQKQLHDDASSSTDQNSRYFLKVVISNDNQRQHILNVHSFRKKNIGNQGKSYQQQATLNQSTVHDTQNIPKRIQAGERPTTCMPAQPMMVLIKSISFQIWCDLVYRCGVSSSMPPKRNMSNRPIWGSPTLYYGSPQQHLGFRRCLGCQSPNQGLPPFQAQQKCSATQKRFQCSNPTHP